MLSLGTCEIRLINKLLVGLFSSQHLIITVKDKSKRCANDETMAEVF